MKSTIFFVSSLVFEKKMRFEIELDIISLASILHTIDQEMV